MAKFEGTFKEFKTHCMASITNKVQYIGKKEKEKRNYICEKCEKDMKLDKRNFHAAHYPKSRLELVEELLNKHKNENNIITCDLNKIRKEIEDLHKPITNVCKLVCIDCHKTHY